MFLPRAFFFFFCFAFKLISFNYFSAHPNLKLFITHGGLLSTIEAVYRGVPIIGIPIFADQPSNMRLAENAGYGKSLDFHSVTSESLQRTIEEMISDPK